MSRSLLATLLFWFIAALCVALAVYKLAIGASTVSFRFAALALMMWAIGRYGPWNS
ncbi:hypothetical protein [Deinococcus peraridilitoris]|uniref:Uncharacterized protein n=1 Tax=Deinococcus peraridilitoris (strain DSM 19664 / LMG 22246 / CIP 109416 / KR-200) TaxID=937777 RepID=L0A4V3_DEIPD|nr:hypothetical protein [Deinococcus peraridilitoris]AFZ68197.1 hypothetical protein Deipe_2733 [Deinococcus peraridilitoris DSM 19664]